MANANTKTATILALGHALMLGARGEAGGAPSKDSIWGLAQVGNTLVSFSGRRGADTLRFTTHKQAEMDAMKAKFASKLAGDNFVCSYADKTASVDQLVPGLAGQVFTGYYKAVAARKINHAKQMKAKRAAV